MLSILDAQKDMRTAYFDGAPGVLCSGLAWLTAALVAWLVTPKAGITTLIFGGMFIFPASVVLCKILGRTGKHNKENPLAGLAIEGTIWMLLSIPIAIGAALYRPEWFFPAMMLTIAGRYLTFKTLYGMRIYWVFAVALVVFSFALLAAHAPVFSGAFAGATIEIVFALIIFILSRRSHPE